MICLRLETSTSVSDFTTVNGREQRDSETDSKDSSLPNLLGTHTQSDSQPLTRHNQIHKHLHTQRSTVMDRKVTLIFVLDICMLFAPWFLFCTIS